MDRGDIDPSSNSLAYTPVRRPEYTFNTRQLQGDPGIEWTTARCHRLLRALTSRVAILSKDLARFSAAHQPSNGPVRKIAEVKSPDRDWSQTKKRIRQTYGGKGKRGGRAQNGDGARMLPPNTERKSLIPGEVLVPTPILARARREYGEEEPLPVVEPLREGHNLTKNKRRRSKYGVNQDRSAFQLSGDLRDLRQKTSAARFTTYEGIYNGLEAFLVATAPAKPEPKRKGARSLFSMALRTVPIYIEQQDGLIKGHMEETGSKSAISRRDISTEIYDELESFGSSGKGWKHLKTVVRSHGIQVVSEAITAGLFDVDFVGCMITMCLQVSAMDEAQALFSSLLSSSQFALPRSHYDKPNRLLSMLWKFTRHTGKLSFQYRELSRLFTIELLPIEWLATKDFGPVWTGLFQTLAPGAENSEALLFLENLLPLLSSQEDCVGNSGAVISEAVTNTLSSLLTILSSIVILSNESEAPNSNDAPSTTSDDIINLLSGASTRIQGESWMPSVLLLLATLFTTSRSHGNEMFSPLVALLVEQLQQERDDDQKSYTKAVLFTCSTARCCGRGALNSGFDYLQHIHSIMETCDKASGTNIFKSLIVDSAFAFAEQAPDRKHLQYAADMDSKFCVRRFEPDSSSHHISDQGDHRSGFRWEEGIGEWVSASPIAVKKNASHVPAVKGVQCDTPYRPPPNLRRMLGADFSPPSRTVFDPFGQAVLDVGESSQYVDSYSELFISHSDSQSDDELAQESSQINASFESDTSFEDAEMSFMKGSIASSKSSLSPMSATSVIPQQSIKKVPRFDGKLLFSSQDWEMLEDSSMSITLFTGSNEMNGNGNHHLINRAPRLGRKALRASQTWQIFDESDDELSFVSMPSQDAGYTLQEITDTSINTRRLRKRTEKAPSVPSKPSKRRLVSASDSEDELCM
jgi:hypothetical protein